MQDDSMKRDLQLGGGGVRGNSKLKAACDYPLQCAQAEVCARFW